MTKGQQAAAEESEAVGDRDFSGHLEHSGVFFHFSSGDLLTIRSRVLQTDSAQGNL